VLLLTLTTSVQILPRTFNNLQSNLKSNYNASTRFLAQVPATVGSNYVDSIGGTVPTSEISDKHKCTVKANTRLYHLSKKKAHSDNCADLLTLLAKPFFSTPDILQAVLHHKSNPHHICLHIFKVDADIANLVYFIQDKYETTWYNEDVKETFALRPNYIGAGMAIHLGLINFVCHAPTADEPSLHRPGWRAPWDQDEVMLCDPTGKITEVNTAVQVFDITDFWKDEITDKTYTVKGETKFTTKFTYSVYKNDGSDVTAAVRTALVAKVATKFAQNADYFDITGTSVVATE